jgi:hypothetical protein
LLHLIRGRPGGREIRARSSRVSTSARWGRRAGAKVVGRSKTGSREARGVPPRRPPTVRSRGPAGRALPRKGCFTLQLHRSFSVSIVCLVGFCSQRGVQGLSARNEPTSLGPYPATRFPRACRIVSHHPETRSGENKSRMPAISSVLFALPCAEIRHLPLAKPVTPGGAPVATLGAILSRSVPLSVPLVRDSRGVVLGVGAV